MKRIQINSPGEFLQRLRPAAVNMDFFKLLQLLSWPMLVPDPDEKVKA